ncbi:MULTISPECIES: hypothetical protein [Variovorax]|jgi:hypothetical protein|uniref:hypothetical protein n=1 Tax=Variovorax TaxID=34072 RepID=UPI00089839D1|nr:MULTISPECIES: hypothetical protein [Variovorax]MDQ0085232.1 hypothetical protein [Variovorax boronicumulans]UVH58421.1 hypothetical protein NWF24_03130 [Variovorax paradoxus]SDY71407.1 hypothetical protein SAMN05518669_11537 [Variovorax sp. YR634]SEU06982.1 hypothetical protein SAMN05443580_113151 [Variovorax sp. OV084]SOD24191.1 hypothetical protein SAMN05518800_1273 [Variovorax sp. YR752]
MSQTPHPTGQLMKLGIAQAVLFVLGALLGRGLGLLLGLDAFGAAGYGNKEIFGILLIGLGGGGGVQLARAWYVRKYGDPKG